MANYMLIGDVHSQGTAFSKALKYTKERSLTPVLLGDLFDSRTTNSETVYTYNLVRDAQRDGAIVLNSNHQHRLLTTLTDRTSNEVAVYNAETWRSVAEFDEAQIDTDELVTWLSSLPDGFVFYCKNGREHCCAHAYFPTQLRMKTDTVPYSYTVKTDEPELKEKMLWGPYDSACRRVRWWRKDPQQSWVRCAGHYHTVFQGENNIVLDAGAGFDGGEIPGWDVNKREFVTFC